MSESTTLPYRPCAGVMLCDVHGRVFVGQRIDTVLEAWQMPQGGIDPGEGAETAARRELEEETGIVPQHVELIARAPTELFYDLPPELIGKAWKGKWRGQRQWWFLFRFLGADTDVRLDTAHPEFRAWRWADPDELPDVAVPFKRTLYEDVLGMFRPHLPGR
ncbi:RNA pyrophosphohydrolase [uncultured Sphingomonas sp.]|uniref:RNA pyrophosphohydrolase n=1 Tax=uncultured Sphingomonas sp. TaxID=158754 RepID=UPI0035CA0104